MNFLLKLLTIGKRLPWKAFQMKSFIELLWCVYYLLHVLWDSLFGVIQFSSFINQLPPVVPLILYVCYNVGMNRGGRQATILLAFFSTIFQKCVLFYFACLVLKDLLLRRCFKPNNNQQMFRWWIWIMNYDKAILSYKLARCCFFLLIISSFY